MTPSDDRRSLRFGRYEILSELGRGAMGVVYKARDPKINRVVAVKTVSLAGQPPEEEREYRERFFREAEAAGRLSHPGIVTIFDVGEEPETRAPYIVMEFVGGQSLDTLLSRDGHKLPVQKALQLTLELAEALDCAHGQGVVHRDLKPANILLTEDGHAKIADFGIAKLNLANQTLGGRALGTPAFMSPEQLNGETVDGRSDLFSLGVVLYTILTGYKPFQGNSAVTVSFKVVNREPIAASLLDTELPPGLDYIIARAMAKDPAERYQRGMEMVLDIQELREGREPWSKAKLPSSASSRGLVKASNERVTLSAGKPWVVAKILQTARELRFAGGNENALDGVRKKSIVGGISLIGLSLFAVWALSFRTHRMLPRTAAPLPAAQQFGSANTPQKMLPPDPAVAVALTAPSSPTPLSSPPVSKAPSLSAVQHAGVRVSSPESPASLIVEVDHKFAQAQLKIWVDNRLAYTHALEATDKKHLVLFHQIEGHQIHSMQISAGNHRLRVRVTSAGRSYDQTSTISGEFISSRENVLQIKFNKSGEMTLNLQP